ncbi:MAG: pectinacetylesterase family protein [Treponema sp.]|jgi:hypothetical protein|nr:pectinacetylesterase family protein [Treponema sp.]
MKYLSRIIVYSTVPFIALYHLFTKAAAYRGSCKKPYRWYRLRLEGCKSSDGTAYYAYYKKGSVNKLVVYFSGGGASWKEETAARPNTLGRFLAGDEAYYFPRAASYMELAFTGIMSKNDPRNPFNDWNYIYLPYATGDFHSGNNDYPYTGLDGKPHILYHQGAENLRRSLEAAPRDFRHPEALLVAGESAGAFGAVANADIVAAAFPECRDLTVYSDGSQVQYLDWKAIFRDIWKTDPGLYACLGDDGQLIRDWFIRLSKRLPGAVLLHSNSAFDETLAQYQYKMNHDVFALNAEALAEFHRGLAQVTPEIKAAVPHYYYYIANHAKDPATGKTAHTSSRLPKRFYEDRVEGISVAEWLRAAVIAKRYQDVGTELLEQAET